MPVDYRSLKSGVYWVRWQGGATIAEWKAREEHWIKGLLGGWLLSRADVAGRLFHIWEDDSVTEVELVEGPLVPPDERVAPSVRFVNHSRYRLGVQVLPAGAVGGAPDRITLIVEDEVERPA